MTTPTAPNGLYNDFPERRTPTPDQFACALAHGMIALDANVLLNLYRYSAERREDLLQFFEQHQAQLFVAHQALREFWTNRQGVLHSVEAEANSTALELSGLLGQASNKLNAWANRIGLAQDKRENLEEQLSAGFREVEVAIRQALPLMTKSHSHDTNDDRILQRLEPLLQGRVGAPLPTDVYKEALKEGIRRFESSEPPGFGDRKKKEDARAGDFLVWEQTLIEAEQRRVPVLFVTDDAEKNDWYLVVSGQRRGPLPELVAELHRRAGTQLFMSQTARLVPVDNKPTEGKPAGDGTAAQDHAAPQLPGEDTADEGQEDKPAEVPTGELGWTQDALNELLRRLAIKAPVQQAAITEALRSGGFVSRETVYMLGDYAETRTLRGFTRPVTGVCQQLRNEGALAKEAADALQAVYDSNFSYVQASGFRVPKALLSLAE